MAVYILYLASYLLGITALIGLILAYVSRKGADTVSRSHFDYQIRTFWIGLLVGIIGIILSFVLVGYLVLFGLLLWTLYRIITGMIKLLDNKPAR